MRGTVAALTQYSAVQGLQPLLEARVVLVLHVLSNGEAEPAIQSAWVRGADLCGPCTLVTLCGTECGSASAALCYASASAALWYAYLWRMGLRFCGVEMRYSIDLSMRRSPPPSPSQ